VQRSRIELEVGRRVPLVLDRRGLGQAGELLLGAREIDREADVERGDDVDDPAPHGAWLTDSGLTDPE